MKKSRLRINEALRLIREFHSVKQNTLANELSISNSYLSAIESGKKMPNLDLLEKYSIHFKVPASSLLLFSESLEDNSPKGKIRFKAAKKILKIMTWIADREDEE